MFDRATGFATAVCAITIYISQTPAIYMVDIFELPFYVRWILEGRFFVLALYGYMFSIFIDSFIIIVQELLVLIRRMIRYNIKLYKEAIEVATMNKSQ